MFLFCLFVVFLVLSGAAKSKAFYNHTKVCEEVSEPRSLCSG